MAADKEFVVITKDEKQRIRLRGATMLLVNGSVIIDDGAGATKGIFNLSEIVGIAEVDSASIPGVPGMPPLG